ncbi:MAG: hypothetical protein RL702_424 [Pseudomonadota bacterium]|jgi:hypothetical protein|nr:hypothetical protein [Novosphingobium sp.]HQN52990.1 hypothetical protein [Novosphingobium sp.]HQQ09073.1 hypothetical protein [Novosphingobium sp.]
MFDRLPRLAALAVIVLFLSVSAWLLGAPGQTAAVAKAGQYSDMQLYRDVVAAMREGAPYHRASAQLQREHGYPLKPFVTMRPPTLYVAAAKLGWPALQFAALLLVLANVLAWSKALPGSLARAERIGAAAGAALGGAAVLVPMLLGFTELWAGLLMSLALALRLARPERWGWTVGLVATALLLRELALPFALLAAAFALWERRWRELAAWGAVLAGFALFMAWHAGAVMAEVRPGDIASPGWSGGQGLRGVLMALANTSLWQNVPQPLAVVACLLPALGWGALCGRGGPFALLLLAGYALMLALFARADNFYWGFLLLPHWFAGYALVPRGIAQLWRAVSSPRR